MRTLICSEVGYEMVYPRPKAPPPQGEALYLLLVYVQDIFCKKDLCTLLVCMQKSILTNNTGLSLK